MTTYLTTIRRYSECIRFADVIALGRVSGIGDRIQVGDVEDAINVVMLDFEVSERLAGHGDDRIRFPISLESPLFAVLASGTPILVALVTDPRSGFSVADGAPPLLVDGEHLAAPDGVGREGIDVATVADVRRHLERFAAESERDAAQTPEEEREFVVPPTESGELPPSSRAELRALRSAIDRQRKWHAESLVSRDAAPNDAGPKEGTVEFSQ